MKADAFWHGLDIKVPRRALGCWQLGGRCLSNGIPIGPGSISELESLRIVHRCLDEGVYLLDTASGYCEGESERRIGKAIRSSLNGNRAVVCTKVPLSTRDLDQRKIGDDFVEAFERSYQRLGVEAIDILLIHNPPDDLNWTELDSTNLLNLVKQGKVKTFGVSAQGIEGVRNVLDSQFGCTIEWVYNLLERRMAPDLLGQLHSSKFNFIARSPLCRGLLTHKRWSDRSFGKDDWRSRLDPAWVRWVYQKIGELNLSDNEILDLANQAILYVLMSPEVSAVAVGVNSGPQLDSLVDLFSVEINEKMQAQVNRVLPICYPLYQ